MSRALTAGDTVYSQDGQEAEFVAQSGGEYIVRPTYEDDDGPQYGDIQTWSVIFRTPPAPKLDAQTAAAEKRLAEVTAKVHAMEATKREFDAEERGRMDRIKRHDQLAELDRYLAGELTHYVASHDYYLDVEIIPVSQTLDSYSSNNGYGILTLSPRQNWDKKVSWSLIYRDKQRESRTKTVIPCCGEEAAKAKAAEVLCGYLADYQTREPAARHYAERLVQCCQKFGVDVPAWLTDGIAASKRASLESTIAKHRKDLAEAETALNAVTGATS